MIRRFLPLILAKTSPFDVFLGGMIWSVGMTGLATLYKIWSRLRKLIEFLVDKWFDRLEESVGMEPGDLEGPEPHTPMDDFDDAWGSND